MCGLAVYINSIIQLDQVERELETADYRSREVDSLLLRKLELGWKMERAYPRAMFELAVVTVALLAIFL